MTRAVKISIAGAVVAMALVLGARSLAPSRQARVTLAPDSVARAVASQNSALLERSLKEQLDVNTPDAEGRSPLLLAMFKKDAPLVLRLLDAGADVDVGDRTGLTPLMLAAQHGDMPLLRKLVERSRDVGAADPVGWTAAHHALLARNFEATDMLVPFLDRLDVPGADGRDLIAMACETGEARFITAVLGRMPSPMEWRAPTRDALDLALENGDEALLKLLLSKHPAPPTLKESNVPLLADAIATGDRPLFDALIAGGADPNTVLPSPPEKKWVSSLHGKYLRLYVNGDKGVTVLMLAAGLGKAEYVRALLDAGATRSLTTEKYKMLALYFASRTENWRTVQMLLGRGPTPEKLRVEISLATQHASVIRDGVPIFKTPVSTGRKGFATPAGQYVITDKRRSHRSSIYHVEMPFFMRLNCLDFGLHQGVVPNYPASHGCIRVPPAAAQKLFAEIPVGTLVTIN